MSDNKHHAKYKNGNGHFVPLNDALVNTARDRRVANLCIIYLLLSLCFFGWQLIDIWTGQHSLLRSVAYDPTRLNTISFRLVSFTVIGGALGAVINGVRSLLNYYNGFNSRYAWKYICAPWMGATLALFVYTLMHSSLIILTGSGGAETISSGQVLSNFAAGALAGYGSKDVFIWMDAKVHGIFQVTEKVPNVTGKLKQTAVSRVHAAHLELGDVSEVRQENGKRAGTVIDQSPPPEASLDRGQSVDIAVATSKASF